MTTTQARRRSGPKPKLDAQARAAVLTLIEAGYSLREVSEVTHGEVLPEHEQAIMMGLLDAGWTAEQVQSILSLLCSGVYGVSHVTVRHSCA